MHHVDALRFEVARQVALGVPRLLSALLTRKRLPQHAASADQMAAFLSGIAKKR